MGIDPLLGDFQSLFRGQGQPLVGLLNCWTLLVVGDPRLGKTLGSEAPSSRFAVIRRDFRLAGSEEPLDSGWAQTPIVEDLATDLRQTTRLGTDPLLWTLRIFEWGQTPDTPDKAPRQGLWGIGQHLRQQVQRTCPGLSRFHLNFLAPLG